ncbi:uncharacterized protein VTP21DRAFT_140 [Calcarisporiella thermophila]|uniref:uncharacterized protein n=1 Tax=Calcarisporiella thermophila TaxID=911321 RepID=UPI0037437505
MPDINPLRLYSHLTTLQSISGLGFTVTLVVHSTAICLAPLGLDKANGAMLLGRELYQTRLEPLLVHGAIAGHVVAGVGKRLILRHLRKRRGKGRDLKKEAATVNADELKGTLRYHAETGYLLIPILGVHLILNRHLPLSHFGDSAFLDFTFVTAALERYPICTSLGLSGLSLLGVYHCVSGLPVIWRRLHSSESEKGTHKRLKRKWSYGAAFGWSALMVVGLMAIGGVFSSRRIKIPLRRDYYAIMDRVGFLF